VAGKRDIVTAGPVLHVVPEVIHRHCVLCEPRAGLLNHDLAQIEGASSPERSAAECADQQLEMASSEKKYKSRLLGMACLYGPRSEDRISA
jgi:hypothetical protein